MGQSRKIIEIDEERCNGCGQCILACAEGALKLVDGKAKLVGDILCDGLGACIGDCPTGALRIVEREAEAFDEEAVKRHLATPKASSAVNGPATLPCGCPSTLSMAFEQKPGPQAACPGIEAPSMLGHWPVKLQLLNPSSPFLKGSDMLLLADCCAVASPDLHRRFLNGKTVAIACPKLDDVNRHIARLGEILAQSTPRTLAVVHMEVPCCTGLVHAAVQAVQAAGMNMPLRHVIIGRRGEILAEEEIALANPPLEHV